MWNRQLSVWPLRQKPQRAGNWKPGFQTESLTSATLTSGVDGLWKQRQCDLLDRDLGPFEDALMVRTAMHKHDSWLSGHLYCLSSYSLPLCSDAGRIITTRWSTGSIVMSYVSYLSSMVLSYHHAGLGTVDNLPAATSPFSLLRKTILLWVGSNVPEPQKKRWLVMGHGSLCPLCQGRGKGGI
jgi:hypothetical protein